MIIWIVKLTTSAMLLINFILVSQGLYNMDELFVIVTLNYKHPLALGPRICSNLLF